MSPKEHPNPGMEFPLPLPLPPDLGRRSPPDLLDDVFGSPPRSPTITADDSYDTPARLPEDRHPSDMPRLRSVHYTSGYRDGYMATKEAHLQPGFDEGYSLGATVGLRAGQLLGVLEGLAEGVPGGEEGGEEAQEDKEERAAARERLDRARAELGAADVFFTPKHWAADGTWTYDVAPRGGKPAEEAGEIVFADVAEAHPVLAKWRAVVEGEMARWGVVWDVGGAVEGRGVGETKGEAAMVRRMGEKAEAAGEAGGVVDEEIETGGQAEEKVSIMTGEPAGQTEEAAGEVAGKAAEAAVGKDEAADPAVIEAPNQEDKKTTGHAGETAENTTATPAKKRAAKGASKPPKKAALDW